MKLQSVKEAAERFNISDRRVQKLCEAGRIEGAQMISNVWLIPDTSSKPTDERFSAEIDDMVSLVDLCKELSISVATGRNWVKLEKLIPTKVYNKTPYFTLDYVTKLKSEIQNGNNSALKSRRNKKFVSGNNIYNAYVTEKSKNVPIIQSVIDVIENNGIEITEDILVSLLADCAVQLVISKTEKLHPQDGLLSHLNGKYKSNPYMFLVDDLLEQNIFMIASLKNYSELFTARYVYEEGEDVLGLLYISLKNIGSRKATGSYYTPTKVVKKLCDRLFSMNAHSGKTVLDPCCGTGNFILQLPESIEYSNVFGNDIDAISVKVARLNFALKYMVFDRDIIYHHITERDFLSYSNNEKYDFIIGNPPWGYDFTEKEKDILRYKYTSAVGSSIESYDVFVEQALHNLNQSGILSFVLPEAFLNVKAHTPIRFLLLKSNSIQYLEFLGNAFDKVQCPCVILQIMHTNRPFSSTGLIVNDKGREFTIKSNRLVNAECLSFSMTDEEYYVIDKICNIKNKVTLEGRSIFALGIVTGNNKAYISTTKQSDNEMVLKGSDLCKYKFHDADNYIIFKPESFQQIAPTEYYRSAEKLLYRFICNQLVFAYDNKQTLSLNSCNILIPQIEELNIKYIMAILNSRMAQFYFKKQFNSVKVLRSHIEQIPIPLIEKEIQERIISMVDSILNTSDKNVITNLYDRLDGEISTLYGLTSDECRLINASMEGENLFLY